MKKLIHPLGVTVATITSQFARHGRQAVLESDILREQTTFQNLITEHQLAIQTIQHNINISAF